MHGMSEESDVSDEEGHWKSSKRANLICGKQSELNSVACDRIVGRVMC